jgi:LPXTG-site transpeptidase (sortase) family protein
METMKKQTVIIIIFLISLIIGVGTPEVSVFAQATTPVQINGIFNPDSIYPSQTSRLTINVYNPNTYEVSDLTWTNSLPDDLVIVNPANPLVTGCGGSSTLTAVPGTNIITLSDATTAGTTDPVNPGICSVTVSVTSFDVGNHTNIILTTDGSYTINGITGNNFENDANITLLVLPMASPRITKSFTSPINEGEISQMEINIRNNDPNVALTSVDLQDTLPPDMFISDPLVSSLSNCGSGTLDPLAPLDTEVNLTGATISPGSTCRIRVNVETSGTGTFTNTITPGDLTNDQEVTIPSNVNANLIVRNVELAKSFSPTNFEVGGTSTVRITITNPNSVDDLTNVTFTDTLPANLTVQSGTGELSGPGCTGIVDTSVSNRIRLTGGRIPAGESCVVSATVTSSIADNYTNTVSCGDMTFDGGTAGCRSASATLRVYAITLGLSATKSFSPENFPPGTATTMTIAVTAPGDTDLSDFTLTDNLPPNVLIFDPPNPTANANCGAGTFTATAGDTVFRYENGYIPAGRTCVLRVAVTSSEYGPHTNTILPTDITNTENRNLPASVSAPLTVRDLSVLKEFNSNLIGSDGFTTLTITLINNYSVPITDIAFSDKLEGTLADGIIIATPSNLSTTCSGSVIALEGSQEIQLTSGSLLGNETCTITLDVQGKSTINPPPGNTYTNTIEIGDVTGLLNGTTATQNWFAASDSLTVGTPEFRINKKFDPILVTGDVASTMTISLFNPLSSALTNISFTDTLPVNMLLAVPAEPSVGTCGGTLTPAADRKSFTYSGGILPGNGSCKLTIKAMMEVTGNRINTIPQYAATTTEGATNLEPTSATLTNLSSVGITKRFSPNPVSPGSTSQLTLTIEKIGIGIGLTGLGLVDTLPSGLTISDTPVATNTCGGSLSVPTGGTAITLTNGALPIGTDTCTIVVSILTPSTTIAVDGYRNIIPPGTITTNEGYTNVLPTEDTLGTIFDPPLGIKSFSDTNLPVLLWKQVWINNTNSNVVNVEIRDEVPAETTYILGSIICETDGVISSTDTCLYDSGTKEIVWSGQIGPDYGATDEDSANNEVVITFEVDVPDLLDESSNQSSALVDSDGDGDLTDETSPSSTSNSNIAVWDRFADELPDSGFAPNRITSLPNQPTGLYNRYPSIELEVPSLGIRTEIVGVPKTDNSWDVSWLGDRAGYLEGTAFPTWSGNSAITGHVYDANGRPGLFHGLKYLQWGDEVLVHFYGQVYVYEVRSVDRYVLPGDTSDVYKHEDFPWLTLITCRDYDEKTNTYASRVLVRAVQVRIEEQ